MNTQKKKELVKEHKNSKICTRCNIFKNEANFSIVFGHKRKNGTRKKMLHSRCKECVKIINQEWRKRNPKYHTIKKKEWIELNKERYRKYLNENKPKRAANSRKYREQLNDWYVEFILSKGKSGINSKLIRQYPELIESKRLIIKTRRLCKTSQN